MLDVRVETITKETALEYLALSGENRPYRRGYADVLAGKLLREEWQVNGDSIRFDTDGRLRDGQHRLQMVAQTGIPIEVVVVRGIDPGSFVTIDTGKKRSLADVLAIRGEVDAVNVAAASYWVRAYLAEPRWRAPSLGLWSHEQMVEFITRHPDLRESVRKCIEWRPRVGGPGYFSITTAMHYLLSRVKYGDADEFISRYLTGLRLEDEDDPVAVLRAQVIGFRAARLKPVPGQVVSVMATAWNATREGRKVRQAFKVVAMGRGARRPRIMGFPKAAFEGAQLALGEDDDNGNDGDNGSE
jgi:hypothetical protein